MSWFLLLSLVGSLSAAEAREVEGTVTKFTSAMDRRDVSTVTQLSMPDLRVSFVVGEGPLMSMGRGELVEMLQAGKVGGAPRTLKIHAVAGNGTFAVAHGTLERTDANFDVVWQLTRTKEGWRIHADATSMQVRPTPASMQR
ncbi:MAG: nuclear transport factor 2 family protein [Deltaproteobacteria bacterium]|nr:nuclear transport factor 2 family protein [Deltaproteobacteria bacterium]